MRSVGPIGSGGAQNCVSRMKLIDVYRHDNAASLLYSLLEQREPHQNISHKFMPTFAEHVAFMRSAPYVAWYLILTEIGDVTGTVYLSKQDEIGVHLFRGFQKKGLGLQAVTEIMRLHPRRRFLANINPDNAPSLRMFEKLGFRQIQVTLECVP